VLTWGDADNPKVLDTLDTEAESPKVAAGGWVSLRGGRAWLAVHNRPPLIGGQVHSRGST